MKRIWLLFLLILFTLAIHANDIYFNHLTTKNGLPAAGVNDIVEDQLGYVWLASEEGLCRFDGQEVLVILSGHDPEKNLKNSFCRRILVAPDTSLFILDNDGVNHYDIVEGRFIKDIELADDLEVMKNGIYSIFLDSRERLWICHTNGVACYSAREKKFYHVNNIDFKVQVFEDQEGVMWFFDGDSIFFLDEESFLARGVGVKQSDERNKKGFAGCVEDQEGKIWWYSRNLYYKEKGQSKVNTFQVKGKSYSDIISFEKGPDGLFWIGTNTSGILVFDPVRKKIVKNYTTADGLENDYINDLSFDETGNLYVISEDILCLFNPVTRRFTAFNDFKPDGNNPMPAMYKRVQKSCLFQTSNNITWMVTKKGVDYFKAKQTRFNYLPVNMELDITNIVVDGKYLFHGCGSGILIHDLETNELVIRNKMLLEGDYEKVYSIQHLNGNQYLVGSPGLYLLRFDPVTKDFYRLRYYDPLLDNISGWLVSPIIKDSHGLIWLGTTGSVNFLHQDSVGTKQYAFKTLDSITRPLDRVWAIEEGGNNIMWFGFKEGLLRYNRLSGVSKIYKYEQSDKHSLGGSNIKCIYKSTTGDTWIASEGGGLSKYIKEKDHFITYTVEDGLPSNTIYGILEDENANLWLSTNNGLSCFNSRSGIFRNFSEKDGILDKRFIMSGYYRDEETGMMYFASQYGILYFQPASMNTIDYDPEVRVTGFSLVGKKGEKETGKIKQLRFNKAIVFSDLIELSHKDNKIEIGYTSLDYSAPSEILFRYTLKKGNGEIVGQATTENHSVNFYDLLPGEYTFEITATNSDGIWASQKKQLDFVIHPPFWKTTWFKIMVASILLSLAYMFYWIRVGQMKRRNLDLERNVKERTFEIAMQKEELQAQTDQLEESNSTKDRLFSIIAHDLRNPIHAMNSLLGMMLQRTKDKVNEQLYSMLVSLSNSATTVSQLLENLLTWSRSQSKNISIKLQPVNVNEIVLASYKLLLSNMQQKDIKIDVRCDESHYVFADKNMIQTVVRNLLSNAIKFTPQYGKISVETENSGSYISIRISDTGIGMDSSQVNQLFELKRNGNSTKGTEGEEGTGLGLIICRDFIEKNNGKIQINSEKGKGTTFTINLPVSETVEKEKVASSRISVKEHTPEFDEQRIDSYKEKLAPGGKALNSILVAEDNKSLLEAYENILQPYFDLILASDGQMGLELAYKHVPDLVITDMVMPKMDGLELLVKLKRDERTSHIPVIMLTAESGQEMIIEGYKKQVDDYIVKPFNPEILMARIINLLQSRENLREIFSKHPEQVFEDGTLNEVDKGWIRKINKIIYNHLQDSSFNQEKLSELIGMSKSSMYNKVKSLTGDSVNQYIQNTRLQESLSFLGGTDLPVSEIANKVGFNDPLYFSRCFVKKYGRPPSAYRKKK